MARAVVPGISTVDAPIGRVYHSVVWSGSEMLVIGGATARDGDALSDGWALDPHDGWRRLPELPEPRAFASAFVMDGEVLVVGGRDGANPRTGGFRCKL